MTAWDELFAAQWALAKRLLGTLPRQAALADGAQEEEPARGRQRTVAARLLTERFERTQPVEAAEPLPVISGFAAEMPETAGFAEPGLSADNGTECFSNEARLWRSGSPETAQSAYLTAEQLSRIIERDARRYPPEN